MNRIKEVMVVDDDPTLLFLTQKFIEITGMVQTVLTITDGKLAFENILARHSTNNTLPEIIFLDINMQDWDGWRTLEELKLAGLLNQLCIYIFTSSANRVDKETAKRFLPEENYIEKPISLEVLRAIFESYHNA
jgi:CheY-like chemotaxis protein